MHVSSTNLFPRIGVAVLVLRDGQLLLGKRRGSHGAGTWALPGGHLEHGETIEACATRELQEETGLDAVSIQHGPYSNDIFAAEGKHYVTLFVLAQVGPGRPEVLEPDKCEGWSWFTWAELPSPLFLPLQNLVRSGFTPPCP